MTTRFLKCSMRRRSTSLIACLTDRSTCKRDAVLIGVAFFHLCYFLFRHVERMIGSWPCRINALTIDRCAGTLRACRHATAGVRGEKPKRSTNGRQNKETEYINNQRGQRRSIPKQTKDTMFIAKLILKNPRRSLARFSLSAQTQSLQHARNHCQLAFGPFIRV